MDNLERQNRQKIYFCLTGETSSFKGKFKLFNPCYAWVKKFEFVQVNHKFDQRGHNKNPSYLA